MKYQLSLLAFFIAAMSLSLKAQPLDRPLNNFNFDGESHTLNYERVFNDTAKEDAKGIMKRMNKFLTKMEAVSELKADTANAIFSGKISNIHPKYFGSSSKEMTGKFTIEVKDGKYKLTIQNMAFGNGTASRGGSGSTVVVGYGYYGMGATQVETLESDCLNKKMTKWEDFAFTVLPQLDDILKKKFKLPPKSDW